MKRHQTSPDLGYEVALFDTESSSEYDDAFFTVARGLLRALPPRKLREVRQGCFRFKHSRTDEEYRDRTEVRFDFEDGLLQRVEVAEGSHSINLLCITGVSKHEFVLFSDGRFRQVINSPDTAVPRFRSIDQQDVDLLNDAMEHRGGRTELAIRQLHVDKNTQHFVSA